MVRIRTIFLILLASPVLAQQPVVAVLNFENTSGQFYLDDVARSFPTLLKTELSQRRSLIVVERQKIDAVLTEQDFTLTDLVEDRDKQAKVGSLLGADFIITGTVTESNGKIRVDAAITQIKSGKVTGEKVITPSRGHLSPASELMAQNITYELTGQGNRRTSLMLKGAPSTTFFMTTVGLAAVTAMSVSKRNQFIDDYEKANRLSTINDTYDKANKWSKTTGFFAGATAVSLGAWIYCVIKNKRSDLEVLASDRTESPSLFAVRPLLNFDRSTVGAQLTIEF